MWIEFEGSKGGCGGTSEEERKASGRRFLSKILKSDLVDRVMGLEEQLTNFKKEKEQGKGRLLKEIEELERKLAESRETCKDVCDEKIRTEKKCDFFLEKAKESLDEIREF